MAPSKKGKATGKKESKEDGLPKWHDSRARKLLETDILAGRIPLDASRKNKQRRGGTSTVAEKDHDNSMTLKEIYISRPEYAEYDYDKFSSRLSSLRQTLKMALSRARDDDKAFLRYQKNHPHAPSKDAKGYTQWQGSEAQYCLIQDMEQGRVVPENLQRDGVEQLWNSRAEYHENYPLAIFRDKVKQQIRTRKYLHTLKVQGQSRTAS